MLDLAEASKGIHWVRRLRIQYDPINYLGAACYVPCVRSLTGFLATGARDLLAWLGIGVSFGRESFYLDQSRRQSH